MTASPRARARPRRLRRALAVARTAASGPDRRAEKILSRRYRFLWICVPKVASRSLIAALRAADPDAALIRDLSLETVVARHPEAREYFSFAFVRHPIDRVRSFFADKHTLARTDADAYRWFIEPYPGLRLGMTLAEFCRWLTTTWGSDAFADRHWLSQSAQIGTAGGRRPDFIGRYERLEADWRRVTATLGLPPKPLPRLNASAAPDPEAAPIDARTAARLRRRYAADFELGRYGAAP